MKRNDEVYCKSVFDKFLNIHYRQEEIVWEDVKLIDERPDYYLKLCGEVFAVEVTQLFELIKVEPSKLISFITPLKSLQDLVANVENRARENDVLEGAYCVSFGEPFNKFGSLKNKIVNGLYDYIQQTKYLSTAPREVIHEWGSQYCSIIKVDNKFTEIRMLGPTGAKFVDGIKNELCKLIREILLTKSEKLKSLYFPKILLILDQYGFEAHGLSNSSVRNFCASSIVELEKFHTVYIVHTNDIGSVLSTQDKRWEDV